VEIPCSEKSAESETSNFGLRFFTFFLKCSLKKKRKKSHFFGFSKKRKNVFSNYGTDTHIIPHYIILVINDNKGF